MVNGKVPLESPKLFGSSNSDAGVSIIMYYALRPEVAKASCNLAAATPAVRLFTRFATNWKTDPDVRRRFKLICMADNLEAVGASQI